MTIFQTYDEIDAHQLLHPQAQKDKIFDLEKKPRIIVIAGPTGVGKTEMGISLAQILDGEIISTDSMQVYKNMDIGTAKATKRQRENIVHHLIDVKEISEEFNVVEFYHLAHSVCRDILMRGKVPILVGGSGFYIHTFLFGPPLGPPANKELRSKLEQQMQKMGPEVMYERLQMLDPEYAHTITENDRHKIIRALEIIALTKRKVSSFPKSTQAANLYYDARLWFLYYPKEILFPKLDMRCEKMISEGFVEEVINLEKMGLKNNPRASQAIGYKQALEFLASNQTEDDKKHFIDEFKKATRRYVKRQFTWFRKEKNFRWINLSEFDLERVKEYILQDYEQGR